MESLRIKSYTLVNIGGGEYSGQQYKSRNDFSISEGLKYYFDLRL